MISEKAAQRDSSKVVIVTGASRGIGKETALWLASTGAAIALVSRSEQELQKVGGAVSERGGSPLVCPFDLTQHRAAEEVRDYVLGAFGRIDAVINKAALLRPIGPVIDLDADAWTETLHINVVAPMALARVALPSLRLSRGRIINVCSGLAVRPVEMLAPYCASKAALLQATKVLAVEEQGVVVCAFDPGRNDTEMMRTLREDTSDIMSPERVANFKRMYEEGELIDPAVSSRVLAWLSLEATDDHRGKMCAYDDPSLVSAAEGLFDAVDESSHA